MSESINLTNKISSSLKIALLSTENAVASGDMPGLSQFNINSIFSDTLSQTEIITDSIKEVEEFNSIIAYPGLVEAPTEATAVTHDASEVISEEESDSYARASSRIGIPEWNTIVSTTSSKNYDDIFSKVEEVEAESPTIVEEVTTITEPVVEDTVEIEHESAAVLEEATTITDSVVEDTEEVESEVENAVTVPQKTEEELWVESTGFGINEIEVVSSEEELDNFELTEEPSSAEPVFENRQKIQEDQVVLVVEQLVVNPNQATTIMQGGQSVAPAAGVPIINTPQQPQTVFYAPPVMPEDSVAAPVMPPVAPAAPQRPIYQTPNMPPVYQAPAAPTEVSVNVAPPTVYPVAPQQNPEFVPADNPPTVDDIQTQAPSVPTHVEQTTFQQKEADQIIEIRSDATSISANTVSVESSQPLIPTLANFDPRKYFSPNEIIAPKLDEITEPKPQFPAMEYTPVRPNIPLPPIEDYRAQPVALGQNSDVVVEQGPEDLQKVTQMFKELRRMRDK